MPHHYPISVCPNGLTARWGNLLHILESLLPIRFSASGQLVAGSAGKLITSDEESQTGGNIKTCVPSLKVPACEASSNENRLFETTVRFADDQLVPFPFQGRRVCAKIAVQPKILSLCAGERALAVTESGPVWSVNVEGGVSRFKSGFALPPIATHGGLKDVLNEERFLEILPLLHWIREICAGTAFEGPPLGACFIFDDPNLHWKRYGFVDFQQIAAHAEREDYHVSFATIPLDSWFAHHGTAEIFSNNTRRISLAIHGNNHTRCELAQTYTQDQRASLLNQAIRRIERFEASTGLRVSRVMVPPHGACSEEMLAELPRFGFESACISHGSLRAHNKSEPWTKTVGYLSSETVHGCPVLPRWGLVGNTTNAILLAAFLKQRIILRGHHQDLKNGIDLLDQHARVINGLNVPWSNLAELSRTNYCWRLEGTTCALKAMGKRLTFKVPEEATQLVVESPHDDSRLTWRISGLDGGCLMARSGEAISLPPNRNIKISVQSLPSQPPFVGPISTRLTGRAVVRRVLAEARDRLLR